MSNEFVCCEKCFESIGRRNANSAKMWLNLCHSYMNYPGIFEIISEIEDFKILEYLGFITSTDFKDGTLIKINGFRTDAYGDHYFCIAKGDCHA